MADAEDPFDMVSKQVKTRSKNLKKSAREQLNVGSSDGSSVAPSVIGSNSSGKTYSKYEPETVEPPGRFTSQCPQASQSYVDYQVKTFPSASNLGSSAEM